MPGGRPRKSSTQYNHINLTKPNGSQPRSHHKKNKTQAAQEAEAAFTPPKQKTMRELGDQALGLIRAEAEKTEAKIARLRALRLATMEKIADA